MGYTEALEAAGAVVHDTEYFGSYADIAAAGK